MSVKKRYLVLTLVNLCFLFAVLMFSVYIALLNDRMASKGMDNLGLVVYAAALMILIALYAFGYGIFSYLYVKNIIFSQLILLGAVFMTTFIIAEPSIEVIIRIVAIYMPFSLIPALITKLIVKLVEYKKSRNITPSPDQPQQ